MFCVYLLKRYLSMFFGLFHDRIHECYNDEAVALCHLYVYGEEADTLFISLNVAIAFGT